MTWSGAQTHWRKAPKQQRSHILVDKVLHTAGSLFEQEGYSNVSTNRIADAANVSIGSIYQYFSGKEAIAFALLDLAITKAACAMREKVTKILDLPIAKAAQVGIPLTFEILEADYYVLLQLPREAPELKTSILSSCYADTLDQLTEAFVTKDYPDIDREYLKYKSYVLRHCSFELTSHYFSQSNDQRDRDRLIDEIKSLAISYLGTFSGASQSGLLRPS